MSDTNTNSIINVYDLFETMSSNEIILIYQGLFDQLMIKTVMSMTEMKLDKEQVGEGTKKKVFNIMIEGLQNICKHQYSDVAIKHNPFLVINRSADFYNVITGNTINNNKINIVKDKLDHINTLNKEELKEFYKTSRLNSVISDVGGAGLGFIDMARKSEHKLEYKFYSIDNFNSFFILQTKISNK
ncbi:MAG: SiaB family protein kinase [Bacteroidota bacterium]